jgi:NAD(P)-dependent dehydrogenase (short-subunit alcohol dehydrogenase family)
VGRRRLHPIHEWLRPSTGPWGRRMINLAGRTALVTGGNKGIGWAVARLLAAQGARLAVNYPDAPSRPRDLQQLGSGAIEIRASVARLPEVEAMFAQVSEAFGRLDILVNNAGIFPRAGIFELTEALWDEVFDVNLKGVFFCAQQAARLMMHQGTGRIINIASSAAFTGSPVGAHYHATKAGVVSLTKSLALALAPYRISVNAIAPGLTDTDQPRRGLSEEEIDRLGRQIPRGRIAQPEDIARAVLYLASDLSDYVTGQTLLVNGGSLMMP